MEDLLCQYANFVEKNLNFLMQEDESVVLMGLEYIGYTGALKAPVRCFGNHLSGKGKSSFQTDNECGGAAILKK